MTTPLERYTQDYRKLLRSAARAGGFKDPVAFDADDFAMPLIKASVPGAMFPLDEIFIRDWRQGNRHLKMNMLIGMRAYSIEGITFVRSTCTSVLTERNMGYELFFCDRSQQANLYRAAIRAKRNQQKHPSSFPVLSPDTERVFRRNTIEYLDPKNLDKIARYGGKPKRGILLTGPPGNGKTSACRWVHEECQRLGWDSKTVTADDYQAARRDCSPTEAVKQLFTVFGRGVIIFDDLDLALRDRNTVKETDDQSVFLTALDGVEVNEAVVYLFTTNCSIDLIDPAFRRPGRIDLTLSFPKPDAELRRKLITRWDEEIREAVGVDFATQDTAGMSYAEIEELKNLLVVHYLDNGEWNWERAAKQFQVNRVELVNERARRSVGFASVNTEATPSSKAVLV